MKFRIAVDIDGVLGDQVSPLLPRLNEKYRIKLSKEDITNWNFAIGNTTIDVEIENALLDKKYVLEMPVLEGARQGMSYLYRRHHVIIATSRPKKTEKATIKWLTSNFKFHMYCNTRGKSKRDLDAHILIDDNIQNIKEFSDSKGIGLLFSQPWNKNRSCIKDLIAKNKIYCCEGWVGVLDAIKMLERPRGSYSSLKEC